MPAGAGAATLAAGAALEDVPCAAALAETSACWSSEDEHAPSAQVIAAASIQFKRGMAAFPCGGKKEMMHHFAARCRVEGHGLP
jgi:hypothetical protein